MQIYRFRDCLLNTAERSLFKENQYVELTTRTFDVLQYLVENSGRIVTKDELLGSVWNGNFVEESNLPVHISKLRKVLREKKTERYIETVQTVGYRFLSPVSRATNEEWRKGSAPSARELGQTETPPASLPSHSVAVLPLRNETGDPSNDYITDGLTESLINSLSVVQGLCAIARDTVFRYKSIDVDVKELGH